MSDARRALRRAVFAVCVLVCAAAGPLVVPLRAQGAAGGNVLGPLPRQAADAELRLLVFSFRNQRAADALSTVRSLLTTRGSVTLDEAANTLAVRDTPAALARVSSAVRAIDHLPRGLWLDLQLIRAVAVKVSPAPPSTGIDAALLDRLRQLFRFESFELLARGRIATREGESVDYEMGDGYRLTFRSGTVLDGRRLKLDEFLMRRSAPAGGPQELLRTVVNLRLDQPLLLGLARDESAERALLLVLRYELAPAIPAAQAPAR